MSFVEFKVFSYSGFGCRVELYEGDQVHDFVQVIGLRERSRWFSCRACPVEQISNLNACSWRFVYHITGSTLNPQITKVLIERELEEIEFAVCEYEEDWDDTLTRARCPFQIGVIELTDMKVITSPGLDFDQINGLSTLKAAVYFDLDAIDNNMMIIVGKIIVEYS